MKLLSLCFLVMSMLAIEANAAEETTPEVRLDESTSEYHLGATMGVGFGDSGGYYGILLGRKFNSVFSLDVSILANGSPLSYPRFDLNPWFHLGHGFRIGPQLTFAWHWTDRPVSVFPGLAIQQDLFHFRNNTTISAGLSAYYTPERGVLSQANVQYRIAF